jgi:subfamily B ATP-binding cassette protein MsbA
MLKPFQQSGLAIYKRLLGYVRRYWLAFLLGVTGTVLSSGTDAAATGFLKPLLDKGFISRDQHFIHWLPLIILGAFLVRGAASFMSNYYMTRAGRNLVMRFRQEMFQHLLRVPAAFYDHVTSGQLLSAIIYNVEQIAKASTDALVTVVQETCLVLGLLTVMLMTSWQLSLVFLLGVPLIACTARYASLRMRRLSSNVQESMAEVTHVAEEAIEGYKVIRTFGGEASEINKFSEATNRNRFREMKMVATNSLATATVQQVAGGAIAIIIFVATSHYLRLTAGGFASMLASMLAILKPLKNLTTVSSTIQKGIAAAESIFKLLDEKPERDDGQLSLGRVQGKIEYRDVNFKYARNEQMVLQNVHFKINPGQTIALVGRSGSGKSTLVNLLPRFYDDFTGSIFIDDIDIRSIRLADLRKQFAFVSQHVTLFNDTIAHNIAYGAFSNASEEDVIKAAEMAHVMEFIRELPDGLNTRVGDNGVLLSGGQRQRIAIARALLKNAPILILDEATSALDTESERYIQAALDELMRTCTTIVIAHRLSTIEKADLILVLEKGQIVEMGNHATLLAQSGQYAKLHRMQFQEQPAMMEYAEGALL